MENNKFERNIFTLLRVLGVLTIVASFLGGDGFFSKEGLLVFKHTTIIGNVFMISPKAITEMLVTIILYLVFIRLIAKRISISRKSI